MNKSPFSEIQELQNQQREGWIEDSDEADVEANWSNSPIHDEIRKAEVKE